MTGVNVNGNEGQLMCFMRLHTLWLSDVSVKLILLPLNCLPKTAAVIAPGFGRRKIGYWVNWH